MPRAISRPMLPVETTSMPWPRMAPSLRRMIEPLPYSFSMAAKARSIALLLFLGSSMAMVLKRDGGHTRARSKLASESHTVNPFSFQLLSRGRSWFASAVASVSTFQGLLGQGLLGLALLAIAFVASACDGSSDSHGDLVSIRRRLEPSLSSGGSSGGSSERSNERGTSPGSADPLTALYADAGLEVGGAPPAPAGDLKAEIARFTTLDACVNERARVDPIVGDALEAIGYDT